MTNQFRRQLHLILLLPLLIAVGVILFDASFVRKRLIEGAIEDANISARHFRDNSRRDLSVVEAAVDNYLAVYSYKKTHIDEQTGEVIKYHTFHLGDTKFQSHEQLYSSLEGLVVANPSFFAVAAINEPDGLTDVPERLFAPMVYQENLRHKDLAQEQDLTASGLYLRGKSSFESFFSSPVYVLDDSLSLITYSVPIYHRDDSLKLMFQIWVDISLKRFCESLREERPFEGTELLLLNKKLEIVAKDDYDDLGLNIRDLMVEYPDIADAISEDDINKLSGNNLLTAQDTLWICKDHLVFAYPMTNPDMLMVLMMPTSVVFAKSIASFRILSITVVALILLLVGSSILIFRTYLKQDRSRAKTAHDLELSAGIQKGFLPGGSLSIDSLDLYAYTRPAEQVGGDLFDYEELDGKLFFCLGDVSGKSIPAALFMAVTESLFRTAVRQSEDPAEIVRIMNDTLTNRNEQYMFCTLFLGVIDPENGKISYCSAGHNPPVVVDTTNGNARYIPVTANRPLGLVEDMPFVTETDVLQPGHALFVYSDGVTEARSADSSIFGDQRLLDTLNSAAASAELDSRTLVDIVGRTVDTFADGAAQSDDITMLCLRRKA